MFDVSKNTITMHLALHLYYQEQHQLAARTGFEPATYGFQIWRSNYSATLPSRA